MRVPLLALLLVLALAGCGGGEAVDEGPDPGPGHIHGLALDTADGSLLVATHTGLFRAAADALSVERVGRSRDDQMGFTVVGPGHFLASGHPDLPAPGEPTSLGLVESRDGGLTWATVSLEGEADLHALVARGDRIYGADALRPRVLVSDDGGRQWEERGPSTPLLDLVAHPEDADRLLASGRNVLLASGDAGRTWAPIGNPIGERWGLLAWPEADHLLVVDESGAVWRSPDGGMRWDSVGSAEGRATAVLAADASELYVALDDGTVKHSLDGGRTWRLRSRL